MPENIELKKAIYQMLREGDFLKAEEQSLQGMESDIHNEDFEKMLKICKFWENRAELFTFRENNAENLIEAWDKFIEFCKNNLIDNKKAVLSVKDFVFRKIVDMLIDNYRLSPMPERETLILLGQAFYEIGMLDKALETLEYALSVFSSEEDVRIYGMLGNLYYESGETDLAMIMFNEAFLKFPQLMDLDAVYYPPVQRIREMIRSDGFRENEIPEWIPVYGYLYGGLTAKKKMEYKDFADLKDKILEYEKSLKLDKKVIQFIIPRLMNYYLWALDYYLYQVMAAGPASQVAKRIGELVDALPADDETKEKLRAKADPLFKKLVDNCSKTKPDISTNE